MSENEMIIHIDELDISRGAKKLLHINNVRTLNELADCNFQEIASVQGVSPSVLKELSLLRERLPEIFERFENKKSGTLDLPDEIKDKAIDELPLGRRAMNALMRSGIHTVEELARLTGKELMSVPNLGKTSIGEIRSALDAIITNGSVNPAVQEMSSQPEVLPAVEDGFDYSIIDILQEKFFFKPVSMAAWFGISRQSIYSIIEKRSVKRRSVWTGKALLEQERVILEQMISSQKMEYSDGEITCCCVNNRQDDFVCLFIQNKRVKCFFLSDLPGEIQSLIADANMHRYSQAELSGAAEGDIVYRFREPYFVPRHLNEFRAAAHMRSMHDDEYARFLSGYPYLEKRATTDEEIVEYLRQNLVDGKVYLSSDPKHQWIRSIASRHGYSIAELIELYGFQPMHDGEHLTTEGARKRHIEALSQLVVRDNQVYLPTYSHIYKIINTYCYNKNIAINDYVRTLGFERTLEKPELHVDLLEQDMQVRQCDGTFAEKIFDRYPLIGSAILKEETLDQLNKGVRKTIDRVLRQPTRLSDAEEMLISIAVINHAKHWKSEENGEFWKYITLQMGYRDRSNMVENIVRSSLEHALKKNNRLFIEESSGRSFRASAVIHALSPRKSWMSLFDFLFDFYKTNLNWKAIPGDPLLGVMIHALQQKLLGNEEEKELKISSQVYSFQEGIKKLIQLRPNYSRDLFERLIVKLHSLVNNENKASQTYEEQLCEEWFGEKLAAIAFENKDMRRKQHDPREVALDYSRINVKYVLKEASGIHLVLPDIRLSKEYITDAKLEIYRGETLLCDRQLSWYGNELGKTLIGMSFPLPDACCDGTGMHLGIRIICDDEVIYDSIDSLNREMLAFRGENEVSLGNINRGKYVFILQDKSELGIENGTLTQVDIPVNRGMKALFAEFEEDFAILLDGRLAAFDNENQAEIKVIPPQESQHLPLFRVENNDFLLARRGSVCTIVTAKAESLQRFVIMLNGKRIGADGLKSTHDSTVYTLSFPIDTNECHLQIMNLETERLAFSRRFALVGSAKCAFNREYYYDRADFQDARFAIDIDGCTEQVFFGWEDYEIHMPFRNGELYCSIPRIVLEESTGKWMTPSGLAWYVGCIPQESILKVQTPPNVRISFYVGKQDIMYDGSGIATIGNVLHSLRDSLSDSVENIVMRVTASGKTSAYLLAKICWKERFLQPSVFRVEDRRLYWNQGGGFIGMPDRRFTLTLSSENEKEFSYELRSDTVYVEMDESVPDGNYQYEISMLSGNMFRRTKEILAAGDCLIGDKNAFRFDNKCIVLESITDENHEESGHISIKTCWIDQIQYQGLKDTSEGISPVYTGVLYTLTPRGTRYEFSFDEHTNDRGVEKLLVNPVRIIYVNESFLCIANSEGDAIYYYYYTCFDRDLRRSKTVFEITDRKYTDKNKHAYSTADLYLYRTERM